MEAYKIRGGKNSKERLLSKDQKMDASL